MGRLVMGCLVKGRLMTRMFTCLVMGRLVVGCLVSGMFSDGMFSDWDV